MNKRSRLIEFSAFGRSSSTCRLQVRVLWGEDLLAQWQIRPGERLSLPERGFPAESPVLEWLSTPRCLIPAGRLIGVYPLGKPGQVIPLEADDINPDRTLVFPLNGLIFEMSLVGGEVWRQQRTGIDNHYTWFAIAAASILLIIPWLENTTPASQSSAYSASSSADAPRFPGVDALPTVPSEASPPGAEFIVLAEGRIADRLPPPSPAPEARGANNPKWVSIPEARTALRRYLAGEDGTLRDLIFAYLSLDAQASPEWRGDTTRLPADSLKMMNRLMAQVSASSETWPKGLGSLKRALVGSPHMRYQKDHRAVSSVLNDLRLNCQSASVAVAMTLLLDGERPGRLRPVLVHTPGHVQPGLLYGDTLYVTEATTRDNRVGAVHLSDLVNTRVVDAEASIVLMARQLLPDLNTAESYALDRRARSLILVDRATASGGIPEQSAPFSLPGGIRGDVNLPAEPMPLATGGDPTRRLRCERCAEEVADAEHRGRLEVRRQRETIDRFFSASPREHRIEVDRLVEELVRDHAALTAPSIKPSFEGGPPDVQPVIAHLAARDSDRESTARDQLSTRALVAKNRAELGRCFRAHRPLNAHQVSRATLKWSLVQDQVKHRSAQQLTGTLEGCLYDEMAGWRWPIESTGAALEMRLEYDWRARR